MSAVESSSQLPGYILKELLYKGTRTAVYRGVHQQSQQLVVIKVMQRDYPTFGELAQFRNQFVITKNIKIPGIVKTLALEAFGNGYALVMEDSGSISLGQYLENQALNLLEIIDIARQLTTILHELHQQRIIHKDIKPANVLMDPISRQIMLIDFSIASLLPKETQAIQSPQDLEGTLAYLAPEQTGRMNRGIDYRTDFYALGVMLYELLTGQLPFCCDDPLEIIHSHIAKTPTPAHVVNPDIPVIVGKIVAKLMAKNAEDRYQSALGLQHDLQECLSQWQARGEIAEFALGQRDLSDRFMIPEKLYGRETEVAQLLTAFDQVAQGASALLLVAGFSGIGKTAVINEVHKPIVRQRGYFIKGKFDQFNRNIPFSAFIQAFRDLVGQLLSESDQQLKIWQAKILAALTESAQVIIDLIPELERITGPQPPAPELSGEAARNRFNLLFQNFIQVFTTVEHPLVIFIDDLQWADSASLSLMQRLLTEAQCQYLLVLGAYRDNEVFPGHPFLMTVNALEKAEVSLETLTLGPLNADSLNPLIADAFQAPASVVQPLTSLVMQKTGGNPFFATQFLKALHQDGLIIFDCEARHWQCNLMQVQDAALTDDVVEFMALQLQKLPIATQEQLKFAACIGAQFDLKTLAIVSEQAQTQVASALWPALQEGLVLPESKIYKFYLDHNDSNDLIHSHPAPAQEVSEQINYRFFHDRVQQAAYSLIPNEQKQITRYQIGKLLLQHTPSEKLEENIFDIVNHLNQGTELIETKEEKCQLSELNLMAGKRALTATAYASASQYFDAGIKLLEMNCWKEQYQLTLSLHQSAIKAEYLAINFDRASALAHFVLEQVTSVLDRVTVYELQIQMYMAQSEMLTALDVGQLSLKLLGIDLNHPPLSSEIHLPQLSAIESLPVMQDAHQMAIMRMLMVMFSPAYTAQPALLSPIVLTAINLSLKEGHTPLTAFAYVLYGILQCGVEKDLDKGYYCGLLALKVLDRFSARELECKVINLFNVFIKPWKDSFAESIAPLEKASQVGFEMGDIEYASYASAHCCTFNVLAGEPLSEVKKRQDITINVVNGIKQDHALNHTKIWQQFVLNLLENIATPQQLFGDCFNDAGLLAVFCAGNDRSLPFTAYLTKCMLSYLFENHPMAVQSAVNAASYVDSAIGITIAIHNFYYSLCLLADSSPLVESCLLSAGENQKSRLEQVKINQKSMKQWAVNAPKNFEHKYNLVVAERCRVLGENAQAIDLYDRAISGAKENAYIQEEALANELAAKFYLNWGKDKVAAGYMQEAYYCYSRWGAKAKVVDLETRYPNLLRPILQPLRQSLDLLNTINTLSSTTILDGAGTPHNSSSSLNQTLDLASVLKASQALSGTLQLDELLSQLTQIILQNSGGDRCALIIPNNLGVWQVRAIATPDKIHLCTDSLDHNPELPIKLIQYVKNSQESVVIDNLETDLPVLDEYLQIRQPKSILCLPILNQGRCIGIVYLKNRLTRGVFTDERIVVLNFFCTQAAISLENAWLYQQVKQSLTDLQQAQLKLVQSEKMSALGGLVSGVAHEINNPVGCILGNVGATEDYVNDLLGLLELYGEALPEPGNKIAAELETVDLDYVRQDLPQLIRAMRDSGDRIKSISQSLRTFSRKDTDHKQPFNLHDGIESTLLILRHRLKGNQHRPEIEVAKAYGQIQPVDCFPGQLNQVFMNILANAIDVFDELAQQSSFAEIKAQKQQISIETQEVKNWIEIKIADNGSGIPPEMQAKVFDHLFTTKAVGKGTGLGLAIARQIVVDVHGGQLQVNSQMGQGTEFVISLPQS